MNGLEVFMISKTIHYCWFGRGEKPQLAPKCIASWKKHCPDYEIIEWNEDNFDVVMNGYTQMCYEEKKYAFLSDYARLVIIAEYGGLYFDTDVELVKSLDELLDNNAFLGFENEAYVNTGLGFGSVPYGSVVEAMLAEYDSLLSGKNGTIGCPRLNTKALVKLGLAQNGLKQKVQDAVIYPPEFFNPYDSATGELNRTSKTISIHWYAASWMSKRQKIRGAIGKPLHRWLGKDFFRRT